MDQIVSSSIGLRWAAAGPYKTFTLGGGAGGFPHFLQHLGPMLEGLWKVSGDARFDAETTKVLLDQYNDSYGKQPITELEQERDITIWEPLRADRKEADTLGKPGRRN